jgi:CDP-diacylglycerol pyrophosphatase
MAWRVGARTLLAASLALAALAAAVPPPARADPEVLWKIVHDQCVASQTAKNDPAPCLAVNLAHGDAVLKDRAGATQVLLIPTARVTGIESAALLAPHAPNYVWDAWQARSYVVKLAGKPIPRDDLALAINSIDGRSQNQLHIHIDCIRADVSAALQNAVIPPSGGWTTVTLAGHPYRARRLPEADLRRRNLFRLIAAGDPVARANMGLETLVVVGATFIQGPPGFILLNDRANPEAGDYASGEELQDHDCKVLTAP